MNSSGQKSLSFIEDPALSYGDPGDGNMLIFGENLTCLRALEQDFAGKIKCIYIDPPFNTGQSLGHYDDELEHSLWLSMMRDRLLVLHGLLAETGLLWVHLDSTEVHYCKVLMDEVFGRRNFVAHVTYERSGSAGLGQGGFLVNTAEYILLYKKGTLWLGGDIQAYTPLDYKVMRRYNKVLVSEGEKRLAREFKSKSNGLPVRVYLHTDFSIQTVSLRNYRVRKEEIQAEFIRHFDKLFRTTNPQKENVFQNELISGMSPKSLYTVDYVPSRGKYKDKRITLYYYNAELFAWLRESAVLKENRILKANKLTDIWVHADIPKADLANEGGIGFQRGKKPEQLIRRILEISTTQGDWVLDAFAGSGTTGAVAQKMGRRWIMCELGQHCHTHIIPRLRKVIDGTDQSGISEAVGWKGGGGFRYWRLAE
ncbi:MAG: site-specific DNA-methyltransferase [bacterium]